MQSVYAVVGLPEVGEIEIIMLTLSIKYLYFLHYLL